MRHSKGGPAASGDEILSATIIVSGASNWMTPYHDRMPVLLAPESFDGWLDGSLGPKALRPAAGGRERFARVDRVEPGQPDGSRRRRSDDRRALG